MIEGVSFWITVDKELPLMQDFIDAMRLMLSAGLDETKIKVGIILTHEQFMNIKTSETASYAWGQMLGEGLKEIMGFPLRLIHE